MFINSIHFEWSKRTHALIVLKVSSKSTGHWLTSDLAEHVSPFTLCLRIHPQARSFFHHPTDVIRCHFHLEKYSYGNRIWKKVECCLAVDICLDPVGCNLCVGSISPCSLFVSGPDRGVTLRGRSPETNRAGGVSKWSDQIITSYLWWNMVVYNCKNHQTNIEIWHDPDLFQKKPTASFTLLWCWPTSPHLSGVLWVGSQGRQFDHRFKSRGDIGGRSKLLGCVGDETGWFFIEPISVYFMWKGHVLSRTWVQAFGTSFAFRTWWCSNEEFSSSQSQGM